MDLRLEAALVGHWCWLGQLANWGRGGANLDEHCCLVGLLTVWNRVRATLEEIDESSGLDGAGH